MKIFLGLILTLGMSLLVIDSAWAAEGAFVVRGFRDPAGRSPQEAETMPAIHVNASLAKTYQLGAAPPLVRWGEDGRLLCGSGTTAQILDLGVRSGGEPGENPDRLITVEQQGAITCVSWAPKDGAVAVSSNTGLVRLAVLDGDRLRLTNNKPLFGNLKFGNQPIVATLWNNSAKLLATLNSEGTCAVWKAGAPQKPLHLIRAGAQMFLWHPNGENLLFLSADGQFSVYRVTEEEKKLTASGRFPGPASSMVWTLDTSVIALGRKDKAEVKLWLYEPNEHQLLVAQGATRGVTAMVGARNGRLLAAAFEDRIFVFDVFSGKELAVLQLPAAVVSIDSFCQSTPEASNRSWLAAGCSDGSLRLVRMEVAHGK